MGWGVCACKVTFKSATMATTPSWLVLLSVGSSFGSQKSIVRGCAATTIHPHHIQAVTTPPPGGGVSRISQGRATVPPCWTPPEGGEVRMGRLGVGCELVGQPHLPH